MKEPNTCTEGRQNMALHMLLSCSSLDFSPSLRCRFQLVGVAFQEHLKSHPLPIPALQPSATKPMQVYINKQPIYFCLQFYPLPLLQDKLQHFSKSSAILVTPAHCVMINDSAQIFSTHLFDCSTHSQKKCSPTDIVKQLYLPSNIVSTSKADGCWKLQSNSIWEGNIYLKLTQQVM